ncbi:MAG TPA: zinc ABC transporter substrate-binding protein [Chthoniobacteraceae bacterium]|nr:zinc ABC transporter substrate-binding protein [Chthoniobacteraceae bacterium]
MKRHCLLVLLFWIPLLPLRAAEKPKVVTFSTILTEIAQRVGGDRVEVTGLLKPGVDPHEYQPKPADLTLVSRAQLILLSAKHMESYVGKLKEATGTKGALVEVGDQFPSLKMKDEKSGLTDDPHWWHSIDNVRRATKVVQDELVKISPADQAAFAANAAAYTKELNELESWVKSEVAKLPRNQRKLVTSHDAFQYFARSFGFTIHPIEGVSPEEQPSSKKVSELIAAIKSEGVKAIFLESIQNPKVVQEITRETGAKIGGTLYADGLGDSPEASTYAAMYKHNVRTIVGALK